ncbi:MULTISPECIES: phage tail protein [Pseudovibrio]|uniref:phage tail protein n=1 Tax=Stappiaceae TaxID=2821832 RepID=UPI002365BD1C|nr:MULTISPECIES: tail fiber protein [Pseudovibrio]MDD7911571.1 tail fiber protein [Pseudovibrio exalbescens]MDX5594306.1 tail fiber protein [Pseudovibrio sp. SPO723]
MSQPFMSQISIFPLVFAVQDWAYCDGQILSISQYNALFSLLGTTFGGNGRTSFGLPEMRGRVAVHRDTNGLYPWGLRSGNETQTLDVNNLPPHTHDNVRFAASTLVGSEVPSDMTILSVPQVGGLVGDGFAVPDGSEVTLGNSGSRTIKSGSGIPFSIMDPFTCMNYEISLKGVYPSRA